MSSEVEVLAYHGWGFDATCWRAWQTKVTQQGKRFGASDRGYFSDPMALNWQDKDAGKVTGKITGKVILTHSFGLHLCPIDQLQQAELLVIFSGFIEFHPAQASLRRRSQIILNQMLSQLKAQPEFVLNTFKAKCYHPLAYEPCKDASSAYDLALLIQDLEHLDTAIIPVERLQQIPKIVILHGANDRIIAPQHSQILGRQLPNSQLIEIPDAGHALPFTHFQTCWSALNSSHASYFS